MNFEQLESRNLLSVSLYNGVLAVNGTSGADRQHWRAPTRRTRPRGWGSLCPPHACARMNARDELGYARGHERSRPPTPNDARGGGVTTGPSHEQDARQQLV